MLERAHILRAPFPHARGSFASPLRGFLVCDDYTHAVRRLARDFLFVHTVCFFVSALFASLVLYGLLIGAGLHLSQYLLCQYRRFPFFSAEENFSHQAGRAILPAPLPGLVFFRPCMGSSFFPCVFLAAAFFFRFVPFPRKVLYNESRYIKISIKEGFP